MFVGSTKSVLTVKAPIIHLHAPRHIVLPRLQLVARAFAAFVAGRSRQRRASVVARLCSGVDLLTLRRPGTAKCFGVWCEGASCGMQHDGSFVASEPCFQA